MQRSCHGHFAQVVLSRIPTHRDLPQEIRIVAQVAPQDLGPEILRGKFWTTDPHTDLEQKGPTGS